MTTENQQQSEVSKFLALLDQDHTEESDLNVIEALVYFHGKYQHVWMNSTLLGNDEGGEKFRRFLNSFRHGAIGKFFVAYIDALFQKHGIVSTVAFKTWVNQKNLQGATSHGASYFLGLGGETNNPGIRIKVNNAFNRLGSGECGIMYHYYFTILCSFHIVPYNLLNRLASLFFSCGAYNIRFNPLHPFWFIQTNRRGWHQRHCQ